MEYPIVASDGTVYFHDDSVSLRLMPGEFVAHRKRIFPTKEGAAPVEQ